jgi:hypothetical protein
MFVFWLEEILELRSITRLATMKDGDEDNRFMQQAASLMAMYSDENVREVEELTAARPPELTPVVKAAAKPAEETPAVKAAAKPAEQTPAVEAAAKPTPPWRMQEVDIMQRVDEAVKADDRPVPPWRRQEVDTHVVPPKLPWHSVVPPKLPHVVPKQMPQLPQQPSHPPPSISRPPQQPKHPPPSIAMELHPKSQAVQPLAAPAQPSAWFPQQWYWCQHCQARMQSDDDDWCYACGTWGRPRVKTTRQAGVSTRIPGKRGGRKRPFNQ